MKKESRFLRDLFSAIVAAVKARSTAVCAKTSAVRTRLIVFGILRNKKLLLSAINRKIHAIVSSGGSSCSHHGEYGGELATSHQSCGGEQHHLSGIHLLGGGNRKAAVLPSPQSCVVEQERSAVVLLSSLPSFAMDRDAARRRSKK